MESKWLRGRKKIGEYFCVGIEAVKKFQKAGMPYSKRGRWCFFHADKCDEWMFNQKPQGKKGA